MKRTFAWLLLLLLTAPVSAQQSSLPASSNSPLSLFGKQNADALEPVDPEKAFRVRVEAGGTEAVTVSFDVDACCYLYRHRTKFEVRPAGARTKVGDYVLPAGKPKTDEFLGKVEVWDQPLVSIRVPVVNLAQAGDARLAVVYQGCATTPIAICYPPTTKEFPLRQLSSAAAASGDMAPTLGASTVGTSAPVTAVDKSFLAYLLGAFGLGLLLTFTPCVLPMIPILSSAIVGSSDKPLSKFEGGLLSYSYVLGTAVTLSGVGYVAGATGQQLQAYFQTPLAIGIFSTLLVLFALAMFGTFRLEFPSAWQSFLHHHGHRLHLHTRHVRGSAYAGVFVLGLLSALIVGACATPIMLAALGTAMERGDPILGAGIMFALSHGQGAILVALGVGATFLLPKAGPWMERVKHIFGALLIAVAIYLLGALPQVPVLFLWAVFFTVCGIFLGAHRRLSEHAPRWRLFGKALGILLIVWGVVAFVGGLLGNRDVFHPLPIASIKAAVGGNNTAEVQFAHVLSAGELEQQLAAARAEAKPVLIDYYADWCTDCLRMDGTTFRDERIVAELARFVVIKADITDADNTETRALRKRFNVYAPPALVFLDRRGNERRDLMAYGYRSSAELLPLLQQL